MAKLRFYYGSMASAKTLRLLTTAYNFEERGIPFVVLKPSTDTRDGNGVIASRVGLKRDCVTIGLHDNILDSIKKYTELMSSSINCVDVPLKWILIDECQFLTEEQVEQLAEIVDTLNIDIMCFGLRTDFRSRLFPGSKRLFELADTIEEVKSSCACGNKTTINARFDDKGQLVLDGQQVLVGGDDKYKSICRKCWNKIKHSQQNND